MAAEIILQLISFCIYLSADWPIKYQWARQWKQLADGCSFSVVGFARVNCYWHQRDEMVDGAASRMKLSSSHLPCWHAPAGVETLRSQTKVLLTILLHCPRSRGVTLICISFPALKTFHIWNAWSFTDPLSLCNSSRRDNHSIKVAMSRYPPLTAPFPASPTPCLRVN